MYLIVYLWTTEVIFTWVGKSFCHLVHLVLSFVSSFMQKILRVDHNGTKLVQNFNLTFLGIIVLLCVEWIMNIPYFSCLFYSHKNNLHFDSLSVYFKEHLLKIKFRKKKPEHSHSMHETVKNEISYWIKIRLIELLCNVCIGVSQSKHQKGRRAYSELSNKPAHGGLYTCSTTLFFLKEIHAFSPTHMKKIPTYSFTYFHLHKWLFICNYTIIRELRVL